MVHFHLGIHHRVIKKQLNADELLNNWFTVYENNRGKHVPNDADWSGGDNQTIRGELADSSEQTDKSEVASEKVEFKQSAQTIKSLIR